jgi:flagellar L-ring protein precursor FlgH
MRGFMQLMAMSACLGGITAPVAAESLWSSETVMDRSLYSSPTASRRGDLITIEVRENTSVTDTQQTTTERQNDASFRGTLSDSQATDTVLPGLGISSDKEFEGTGQYTHTGRVTTTFTGRVIDVLDNGNMVIEARRAIRLNKEVKDIRLTGVIRREDVSPDNRVSSENIHNFEVQIVGEGPLSRSQQQGLIGQLLDIIWPF